MEKNDRISIMIKSKHLQKSLLSWLLMLAMLLLLAGCGATKEEDPAPVADESTQPKTEQSAKPKPAKKNQKTDQDAETKGEALSKRLCGSYSFHYNEEEASIVSFFTFGGNLYAYGGDAMTEEGSDYLEPYSFWMMELLPENAQDLQSTSANESDVYVLTFSIMSNLTTYWSAPEETHIALTDDGVEFQGNHYIKDDNVEYPFPYFNNSGVVDEGLMGVWRQKGEKIPWYLDFDGQTITIYRKDPGTEVFFGRGGYEADEGYITGTYSCPESGGMPYDLEAEYSLKDDGTLVFQQADFVSDMPETVEFEKITEDEIPVVTLKDAQEAGLTDDREYDKYAQQESTDQINEEPFYGVWAGAFFDRGDAWDLLYELTQKGFNASIVFAPDWENLSPKEVFCVTADRCADEDTAKSLLDDVKAAGYKDAYVKASGKRTGVRINYTLYSLDPLDVTDDMVVLHGVQVDDFSGEEPLTMDLYVDKNTGFDKSCDMQFFNNYTKGDTALDWIKKNYNSDSDVDYMNLIGVFDVAITDSHIDRYYGCYWWD